MMRQAPPGYYVATGDDHWHLACIDCGAVVTDFVAHDKWCPAKDHERKMAGYAKVYNFDHKEP
jgi:Fe2+ or Zn2+ uptake regulation protein